MWLWAAVTVGKKNTLYTHENGMKKFTFKLLPRKEAAIRGKPRGVGEIAAVLHERVAPGSFLLFDKWLATESAVRRLGYAHAPAVNHSKGWRDTNTGYHSNDIESENSRLKGRHRKLYGRLVITELDLYEYMLSVNRGFSFTDIMQAYCCANGGQLST